MVASSPPGVPNRSAGRRFSPKWSRTRSKRAGALPVRSSSWRSPRVADFPGAGRAAGSAD